MRSMGTPILIAAPPGIPREMLCGYLQRMRESVPGLRDALARRDFGAAKVYGHRLKGSGGAYGVPGLSEIGAGIELAAKGEDVEGLCGLADRLGELLGGVEVA